MSTYKAAFDTYKTLADKAAKGDKQAMKDKAQAFQEVRAIEREAAREGALLAGGEKYGETESKRSLQEEYVRRFDSEKPVDINGKQTTLRDYHAKRLLGR